MTKYIITDYVTILATANSREQAGQRAGELSAFAIYKATEVRSAKVGAKFKLKKKER